MEQRALTKPELEIVQWLLENARMPDSHLVSNDLDGLRVVDHCDCGCVSIDFEAYEIGAKIIADAVAKWPDRSEAGLILWGRAGRITALEVYEMTTDSAKRLPTTAVLRTWEQIGEEKSRS